MSTHDPRDVMAATRNAKTGVFTTVADPIAKEVRNAVEQKRYYHTVPVVPFMEQGDASLEVLTRMAKLSPTHAAVMNSMRRYILGGQFEVVSRKVSGFARREEQVRQVEEPEFVAFTDWLTNWVDGSVLLSTWQKVYDNFSKYGNAFVEVVLTTVAGQRHVAVYNHDVDRVLYLATLAGMPRIGLISPYWYHSTNYGEEPQGVPLWPEFLEDDMGTKRTLIHLKHDVAGREWYGEPYWLAALYYVYMEMQAGQYNVEGYANNFTGELFVETYEGYGGGAGAEPPATDPAYDAAGDYVYGPQGFYKKLTDFFTNKGIHKRKILHRNAASDGKETKVHQFKPNTNEKYHQALVALSEAQVIKMHDWHPALMGIQTPGRLGQNQEFATAFRQKYYTVIKPYQDMLADPLNLVLRIAAEFLEDEGLELVNQYGIGFKNLYQDMLKETEGAGGQPVAPPAPGNQAQPDEATEDEDGIQQTTEEE